MSQITEQDVNRLCDRLIRTTPERGVYRDNLGNEAVHIWKEPPLFDLLREAIHPDMVVPKGGGGGGAASGSRAALSVEAVDLFMAIDQESWDLRWLNLAPGMKVTDSMERRVLLWVQFVRTKPEGRLEASRILRRWITRIESLLDPPKTIQMRGTACPACNNVWAMVDDNGELVRKAALHVTVGTEEVLARCLVCSAEWPADRINDLAEVLNPKLGSFPALHPRFTSESMPAPAAVPGG